MSAPLVEPSACTWCGIARRGHGRQYADAVGWHEWAQPSQEQILARMKARRLALTVAKQGALPVPVGPELPEPEHAAEQLDFLHRITLPELRREIEHHKDGKARWRKRAETAEARVAELEAARTGPRSGNHSHPQTGDVTPQVQKPRALLAGQRATQETDPGRRAAWRMLAEPLEDPHDSPLTHRYAVGRDLPETGGAS